jgi:hypothetical protein
MTNEFGLIGERRDDQEHLLLRGGDGQLYDYSLRLDRIAPVEPDDGWMVDERGRCWPKG